MARKELEAAQCAARTARPLKFLRGHPKNQPKMPGTEARRGAWLAPPGSIPERVDEEITGRDSRPVPEL